MLLVLLCLCGLFLSLTGQRVQADCLDKTGGVNYVYVDDGTENAAVSAEDRTVKLLVSYGAEDTVIGSALLELTEQETGTVTYVRQAETLDNTSLFEMSASQLQSGVYEATGFSVLTADGQSDSVLFAETGMQPVCFAVGEAAEMLSADSIREQITAEQITEESELDTQVYAWDAQEQAAEEEGVSGFGLQQKNWQTDAEGNVVIVLDPGHDATHAGAQANGLSEETLNLKIAQYCKEELSQYQGVTVYMTRETEDCPYPGTTSAVDNANRVAFAKSVNADAYVALHLNSATNTSAKGVSVYYPNANYQTQIGADGKAMAEKIQAQLVALGLNDREILIRNSEDNSRYPDGSLADYYGVIKNAKLSGFPGLIVEHAFLTNSEDVAFLSDDSNLQKLGQADAAGIAEYFGLSKQIQFTSATLAVIDLDEAAGTFRVTVSGIEPADQVEEIWFAVWSNEDNRIWYKVRKDLAGNYVAKVDLHDHGSLYDTYYIHAYVYAVDGTSSYLKGTEITISKPEGMYYYGDVNLNGTVGAEDALVVLQHVVQLKLLEENSLPYTLADVTKNGKIEADDALQILKITVKLTEAEVYTAPETEAPETVKF